jgi:dephospho-CoA kinase
MRRIALTGNIASGKSVVAEVWQRLGAAIVDADALARDAVATGSPGLARVVERFGRDVLDAGGALDRAALRRRVFTDADARADLEAIVHPEVARLREVAERALATAGHDTIVHVIPLLFEAGLADPGWDAIVLVDAPEAERLRRLVALRGLPEREARAMIGAQMPAGPKRTRATHVIDNDGTRAALEARAEAVWREIREAAAP